MQRHELAVIDADASDPAAILADNLIHELHGFEDAQDLPRDDLVADFHERLHPRRRRAIKNADQRSRHFLDVGRGLGRRACSLGLRRRRKGTGAVCRRDDRRSRNAHPQVKIEIAKCNSQPVKSVALHELDKLVKYSFVYIHVAYLTI